MNLRKPLGVIVEFALSGPEFLQVAQPLQRICRRLARLVKAIRPVPLNGAQERLTFVREACDPHIAQWLARNFYVAQSICREEISDRLHFDRHLYSTAQVKDGDPRKHPRGMCVNDHAVASLGFQSIADGLNLADAG